MFLLGRNKRRMAMTCVWQESESTETSGPQAPGPWLYELRINRLRYSVEAYYWAVGRVLNYSDQGFSFYRANKHQHTHPHTHPHAHPHTHRPRRPVM